MSRYVVSYGNESLDFELPAESVVGCWNGPDGMEPEAAEAALRAAIEQPRGYPPLRQVVVPGDHVAIAIDSGLRRTGTLVKVLREVLNESGVEPDSINVVALSAPVEGAEAEKGGPTVEIHDPSDRDRLSYLATTAEGRRVYLNRTLTDADVVLPVGLLRYDPLVGRHGPWSLIFPGLSDQETGESYRRGMRDDSQDQAFPQPHIDEALEASWLLGSQMQIGVVPGVRGPAEFVAGLMETVRDQGADAVDRLWSFQPEARAELVVAGIGRPGVATTIDDLAAGLATASRLVRHGGKIVALCQVREALGPALQRLIASGDSISSSGVLSGHESDRDSVAGRRLAKVLGWADVYLLSGLDHETVEDLSMIPVERIEDVRRLAARAASCTFVSQAEWTRGFVPDTDAS
ncbi:lactate racemase domain-containing protein [Paludisphaera borealis]|uniref:LarA-like N-terminal domain-containing protein n=1 Tax=Paludisphaera borealis TaxID=1387353 RepID=A0A1U7CNB9_9BACT|nr:lactate racemase domain-containing protein [Paludisphaera borealis]APW60432.1 hypothetical protein BSF38_01900 [Paludisphaera borealis]